VNRLLLDTPVGREVTLVFRRDGAERQATATTVSRGAAQGDEEVVEGLGVTVRELTLLAAKELSREPGTGVLVSSVRPGSAASEAKPPLQPGDIIVALGRSSIADIASLRGAVNGAPEGPVLIGFERRSERLLTAARLGRRGARDRSIEAVKAWVPVATQVLTGDLASALGLGLGSGGGVRVTEVYSGSTAEAAGIRVGDVFVRIDGLEIPASQVEDAEVFASMVRQYRVGSTVELAGYRDGSPLELEVELSESPRSERELSEYRDVRFDFSARDLTFRDRRDPRLDADLAGALVTGVESGGWAALARLAVGDVVLAVDGSAIRSGADLEDAMGRIANERPRRVVFLVRRGVSTLFLELEPDWGSS